MIVPVPEDSKQDSRIADMPTHPNPLAVTQSSRDARPHFPVRVLALSALLLASILLGAREALFSDGDLWWHLRAGLWILEHHAVPRTALFSQYLDLSWVDTNWGFDALLGASYKLLGLRGIPVLFMFMCAVLAVVAFLLARSLRAGFWWAVMLSLVAQIAPASIGPRPAMLSIIFFTVELLLLFVSRRPGMVRTLYWLPLLFVGWANVDEHSIYGLLVLLIFLFVVIVEACGKHLGFFHPKDSSILPQALKVGAVTGATLIATLLSPYAHHSYETLLEDAYGPVTFLHLPELHAMNFRQPQHYFLLLLGCAAFLVLGRKRFSDPFQLVIMVVCAALSFHRQTDAWLVVMPAIAVLAGTFGSSDAAMKSEPVPAWKLEATLVTVIAMIALVVTVWARVPENGVLLRRVGAVFPVKACDYIRQNHLPSPLFNAYYWGGFLTWYLPEYPVAIDGRLPMYGAEANELYFKVSNGLQPLNTDTAYVEANTMLLEKHSAVAEALPSISGFKIVYSDDMAVVAVRTH